MEKMDTRLSMGSAAGLCSAGIATILLDIEQQTGYSSSLHRALRGRKLRTGYV